MIDSPDAGGCEGQAGQQRLASHGQDSRDFLAAALEPGPLRNHRARCLATARLIHETDRAKQPPAGAHPAIGPVAELVDATEMRGWW